MKKRGMWLAFVVLGLFVFSCADKQPEKAKAADGGDKKKAKPAKRKNPFVDFKASEIGRHAKSATHVVFSPDGNYLLSSGKDNMIKMWDVANGGQIRTFRGHKKAVMMADFSPDGKLVVSASADETVRVWDAATGKQLKVFKEKPPKKKLTEEEEAALAGIPPPQVNWAAFSPDGTKVISASDDFALKLWDIKTGKKTVTFQDDGCRQRRVVRRRDQAGWVSSAGCMDDGVAYLKFWGENGQLQQTYGSQDKDAHYLAYDHKGKFLVTADGSMAMSIYSAQGSFLKRGLVGAYHFCLEFTSDDKALLIGTDGGEVFVIDVDGWKRVGKLAIGEREAIDSLAVSTKDGSLALALRKGRIMHFASTIGL